MRKADIFGLASHYYREVALIPKQTSATRKALTSKGLNLKIGRIVVLIVCLDVLLRAF